MEHPLTSDVLTELEMVHETGHFSSILSLEEKWQQVSHYKVFAETKKGIIIIKSIIIIKIFM